MIFVVVNLDPHHPQSGWLQVPLAELGLSETEPYQGHDLLGGARFLRSGARNYVSLNPQESPAYVFRLRRKLKTEPDFDYLFEWKWPESEVLPRRHPSSFPMASTIGAASVMPRSALPPLERRDGESAPVASEISSSRSSSSR